MEKDSGLNDDLNGYERPVEFDIKHTGENVQIIHSLAKWKRKALKKFGYKVGEGIYCDMKAIRRDEELDNTHSLYVDQWSWEKIIKEERQIFNFEENFITIIELLDNDFNENPIMFLEVDIFSLMMNFSSYVNKAVLVYQRPGGNDVGISFGTINEIVENNLSALYDAETTQGSSGSPVILGSSLKLVGIHIGKVKSRGLNIGSLIGYIIKKMNG